MKLKNTLSLFFLCFLLTCAIAQTNQDSPLGINLPYVIDYNSAMPFQDFMKSSRGWASMHNDSAGWNMGPKPLDLDENGWVRSLENSGHYVISAICGDYASRPDGQYHVFYEGKGTFRFTGGASFDSEPEPGHIIIDVTTGGGSMFMEITETDPDNDGSYIKNIQIIPEKYLLTYESELWNPDYLKIIENFKIIRPLHMRRAWGSIEKLWTNRTKPNYYTQSIETGVCIEYIIQLANQMQTDLWLNVPHMVDDDYVTNLATIVRDSLDSNLKIYVEYGNEVWNPTEHDADYADSMSIELGLAPGGNGLLGRPLFYAQRSVECFDIFETVFGNNNRLIRVLAWQSGGITWIEDILNHEIAPGDTTFMHTDAFAIAPYFGYELGLTATLDDVVTYSVDKMIDICEHLITKTHTGMRTTNNYVSEFVNDRGEDIYMISYEGGQHIVGSFVAQLNEDFNNLMYATNRNQQMRNVYVDYHNLWKDAGGRAFVDFELIGRYSKSGSWGLMEDYSEINTAPKYGGVMSFIEQNSPQWWTQSEPTPPPIGDLIIDFDASTLSGISMNRTTVAEGTNARRMNFDTTTSIFSCADPMGEFYGGFYFNWDPNPSLTETITLNNTGFSVYMPSDGAEPVYFEGITLWKKEQFLNGYDVVPNVTLGKLELNIAMEDNSEARFLVKNGSKYYMSNFIAIEGYNELTEFDNSLFVSKRWMELTPGTTNLGVPHWRLNPICNTEAVTFDDVQQVGVIFSLDRRQYGYTFKYNSFKAYTRSNEELSVTINPAIGQENITTTQPVNYSVKFNMPVADFEEADITFGGNANPTNIILTETGAMDGTTYNIAVSGMSFTGFVFVDIDADVASNSGNLNSKATTINNYIQYNISDPPEVTVEQDPAQDDPDLSLGDVRFIATFNEAVTGFGDPADVSLSGTAVPTTSTINEISPNDGTTYEILVSGMTQDGTVIAEIPTGVAYNISAAANLASTSIDNSVYWYISNPPQVTINQAITQNDPAIASNIFFTAVFNQAVTGFETGDVIISGTAGAIAATITEIAPNDGTTYSIEVSMMSTDGTVIVDIPAGICNNSGILNLESESTDNEVYFFTSLPLYGTIINFQGSETPGATLNRSFVRSDINTQYIPFSTDLDSSVFVSSNNQAEWYGGVHYTSLINLDTAIITTIFNSTDNYYYSLIYGGTTISMHENTGFFMWKKEQFLNNLNAVNVGFNNDTALSSLAVNFNRMNGNSGFEFHFVIKQNDQYYISEYEESATNGYTGLFELKGFNNKDSTDMRWGEFNPTESDFTIPEVLPGFAPVDFFDIQEVGFIININKDIYGAYFGMDAFIANAVSIIPQYDVTFTVDDGTNPIENAEISFNSQTLVTNSSGQASFVDVGVGMSKAYSITATGFITASGNLNVVDQDINESVSMTAVGAGTYTVTFSVNDGSQPIDGAEVTFSSQILPTNTSGNAVFAGIAPATNISYSVSNAGYDTESGTITVVDQDVSETVTLSLTTYTLSVINGSGSGDYLPGSQVNIIADAPTVNQVFDGWSGDVQYLDDSSNDTAIVLMPTANINITANYLTLTYEVTFVISDGTNPIQNATVNFSSIQRVTDASGTAIFGGINAGSNLLWSVFAQGYYADSGTVDIVDYNITQNVILEDTTTKAFDVTFVVTDGTNPVEGASIDFASNILLTDASGTAVFNNIGIGSNIEYSIILSGYAPYTGTVNVVNAPVTENVTLILTDIQKFAGSYEKVIQIYPLPAKSELNIIASEKISSVQLLSVTGKKVIECYPELCKASIDVSALQPGIYFTQIKFDDGSISVKKVIKE